MQTLTEQSQMELNFDNFTFTYLLIPQIAVLALVPFIIHWFTTGSASRAARAGMVVPMIGGFLAISFFTFVAVLMVGMSQQPIGPLGARLLHMQVGILIFLLALAVLAAIVAPGHKIGTIGMWEFAIMAGLVPFWYTEGLAPDGLNWPIAVLALALGAIAGLVGGLAVTGSHDPRRRLAVGPVWAAAGTAGVALGLLAASLTGAQVPPTVPAGPPSLPDQLDTLLLVAVAVGTWLGLCTLASSLTGPIATQRIVLAKGLLGELILLAVWLAASFALKSFYPAEYGAHLAPAAQHAVTHMPGEVAAADADGDGHAELIARNDQFSTVNVLLANADGTFRPGGSALVGEYSHSIRTQQ
jgi:hypothetical protein